MARPIRARGSLGELVLVTARAASMNNPRAKLARAYDHIRSLGVAINEFLDSKPFSVETVERAPNHDVAVLRVDRLPPLTLGVVFGDVLSNWRSALDNLMTELVLFEASTATNVSQGFPIFMNEADFSKRGRLRGVSGGHREMLRALHPFENPESQEVIALQTVNQFASEDRHQAIHPTFAGARDVSKYARSFRREGTESEMALSVCPVGFGQAFRDGLEVAHFLWHQPVPYPKPHMTADLPIEIGFGPKGLTWEALSVIHQHLIEVVERFAFDISQLSS